LSNNRTISASSAIDIATFTILSEGQEVSRAYQVVSITVTHEINRIPSATIIIVDGEAAKETFEISDKDEFIPGKKIQIKVGYGSVYQSIFKGIVIRHSIKIRKNGSFLTVECRDQAVKMTIGAKNKYFVQQKDSEIIESLIRQYGLQPSVEATQEQHKKVVQVETTDWDFMAVRADLNGKLLFVEDGTVKVAKPDIRQKPVQTLLFGSTILEFDAEIDARHQFKNIKAIGWNPVDQALDVVDAKEPAPNNQGNLKATDLANVIGLQDFTIQHPGATPKPELQAWANARLQKARMAKVRGRAKFQGTEKIKPGMLVTLQGVGNRFNGDVYITGVRHQIAEGNWETDVQFGVDPEWFTNTVNQAGNGFESIFPSIRGLQCGIVTALENDPEGEDRIQVRLPLISDSSSGIWARVSTLDAGNERGTFFRPEIGDEVVLGFLGGDARHPVVLGMLNSSAKPAPMQAKDDNNEKGFISRSKMIWIFDDDKKNITVSTPAGNKILISEDDKGIRIEDQNGNALIMDSSGIQLKSIKDLKITATANAEVGGVKLTLTGQTGMEINGGASLKVAASGIAEIKGGLVKIN
jgi:Rhs element Vgr protein